MPEQDITWRPVGFKEVFRLLDLDRYDDIILDKMNLKRTGENPERGSIEVFQAKKNGRGVGKYSPKHGTSDDSPHPITDKRDSAGKSLGVMPVGTARKKFL